MNTEVAGSKGSGSATLDGFNDNAVRVHSEQEQERNCCLEGTTLVVRS